MRIARHSRAGLIAAAIVAALGRAVVSSQSGMADEISLRLPNPNPTVVDGWGTLPAGRVSGISGGLELDRDGNIWTYERCGANTCDGSAVDPILKFDRKTGALLKSFGSGMFVFPHGLYVDRDGNIWVTDGAGSKDGTKGHQVIKFTADGKELMRLGTAGKAGIEPGLLNEPCDVVTAPNGDIFVADGHSGQNATPPPGTTGRIVKFSKDGKYLAEWGHLGTVPGDFRTPHALAFDSRGRLFVGDRGNARIQIFDQGGKLLEVWTEFGRPSGIFIDAKDNLYVIDADTNGTNHSGWSTGIRIGTAREQKVLAFIPPHKTPNPWGVAGEGVLIDADGTIYEAPGPASRPVIGGGLTRYLRP